MIDELISEGPWLLLLVQGTACLAVGLAASYALRHRPARAHQALLTALLMSVFMPGLYLSARYSGLGVFASKPTSPGNTSAVARASWVPKRELIAFGDPGPWTSDTMGSVGPDEARPGWPRHEDGATDISPLHDLLVAESTDESTLSREESIGAIPAPRARIRVPWSVILIVSWSTATALLLLRLVLRFLLGWRVVQTAQSLDNEPIHRALDTAQGRLGVEKSIQIRRSGSVHSPVIWGWSREPVLLVQENASRAGDRTDWTGVFCHEISHWRRRDHVTGLVTEVLTAALPWHPLLWWAKDRLLRLSEQACDDWVLATGQNDADYAELLLGLAAERQMAFLPTTIGKGKTMNQRIRRIITDKGSDPRIGARWALAVGLLAVGATVGVAVAQPRPTKPDLKDPRPTKVVKERREIEVRESPGTEQQRVAMKRVLERLMQQAGEKKEMLRPGNDLSEEERQVQQIELKLLVDQIEQMKSRLETPERAPRKMSLKKVPLLGDLPQAPDRGPRKIGPKDPPEPEREARFEVLRQEHEELEQRAQKLERELKGLRDGQDQEAQELKSELEKIRDKKVLLEKEMEELKRAQADDLKRRKLNEPQYPQVEVRREIVLRDSAAEERDREEKLQHLRMRAEKLAQALREEPDLEAEKTKAQRRLLEAIRAQIGAIEQESRGLKGRKAAVVAAPKREYRVVEENVKIEKRTPDGPARVIQGPADNPQLEAEVRELRVQMKELHEQMQQMREMLEQSLDRGPKDRPAK